MRYRARLRDFDLAGRNILCNILQNDTMALWHSDLLLLDATIS